MTTCTGASTSPGSVYAKFHLQLSATNIRQKPSERSILAKLIISSAGTAAINWSNRARTRPTSLTGYAGDSLVVVSFTDGARGSVGLLARASP
jgi:hypothetical protein